MMSIYRSIIPTISLTATTRSNTSSRRTCLEEQASKRLLPAHYVATNMRPDLEALWAASARFAEIEQHGVAFWFQTM
jgi:hypothetical protein